MSENAIAILILDAKIQKQRLRDMKNAAQRRKITTADSFSSDVTHIVTEYDTVEAVLRKLGLGGVEDLGGAQVVKVKWFTDCMKAGHAVDIVEDHKVPSQQRINVSEGSAVVPQPSQSWMTDYACQRATPLKHLNGKFTDALELLQEHAELRDGEQDYSRALAFRRASCVLKSMPFTLTSINQLRNVLNIGGHSRRIIQEILEDGESPEVEDIKTSAWYQKMKLFSGVFGIGPSTAKKWIEKGWSSVNEAQQGHVSGDWRVNWGLAFHEELTTPVTQAEAVYIRNMVQSKLDRLLPGSIMEVTGGFRRGKKTGHDVDILITHPEEGREIGVLPRLLWHLQSDDVILCGKLEKSTFTSEVLYKDFKLSMRGQLDHFEKWIGIFKVPKSVSAENKIDQNVSVIYERKTNTGPGHKSGDTTESVVEQKPKKDEVSHEKTNKEEAELCENGSAVNNSASVTTNLNESIDDYESSAKKQRKCEDSGLTPLEMSQKPRDWLARRVDLIVSPYSQYYYALVGWTGNKQFNRDLRTYAKRELGMHLTSHGLYDLNKSMSVPAGSEKEVFERLKITYREPSDRNC